MKQRNEIIKNLKMILVTIGFFGLLWFGYSSINESSLIMSISLFSFITFANYKTIEVILNDT